MYPSRILQMQAARPLMMQPSLALRMQPTRALMRPVPKEEHSAHTISQRLRTLKKTPPELIPLGIVLAVAIGAAVWSLGHKLFVDKTLRLTKTNRSDTLH